MYNKLNIDDYVPYAPSTPGTSINIKHKNCDNGEDWKERLNIKLELDNTILAFCHNCQSSGRYKDKKYIPNLHDLLKTAKEEAKKERKSIKPPALIFDINEFPLQYRAWINKYNIEKKYLMVGYSREYDRILFPICTVKDGLTLLVGWQGRSLDPDQPKYITVTLPDKKNVRGNYITQGLPIALKTVVLTEDSLSAMKVAKYLPAISLQGVHLNDELLRKIANKYNNVIIFLDDDNATVKKCQLNISHELSLVLAGNVIIAASSGKDPKEYTYKQLKELLLKCLIGMKTGVTALDVTFVEAEDQYVSVSGIRKEKSLL